MRNIILRYITTIIILLLLRGIYVFIVGVPFLEQVFISTSIGLITSQLIIEVIISKQNIKNYKK